jgi:RNA polymerase sigma-70 factor (ECF subfamily)
MAANDEDLLKAARAGDTKALEALLERYQSRIYRFGIKMCHDTELAKDILQETLLAVARSIRNFRGASSFSTWLYAIARSFCIKNRRKNRFSAVEQSIETGLTPQDVPAADPAEQPDNIVSAREVEAQFNRAIQSLEPSYREVFVLRDIEGLSGTEVAEVLGITLEAVKSRLHRARAAVRQQLAPVIGVADHSLPPASSVRCKHIVDIFSKNLEGEITPEVCHETERHLENCLRCRSMCDSLKHMLALCQALPQEKVPPHVQQMVREALRRVSLS